MNFRDFQDLPNFPKFSKICQIFQIFANFGKFWKICIFQKMPIFQKNQKNEQKIKKFKKCKKTRFFQCGLYTSMHQKIKNEQKIHFWSLFDKMITVPKPRFKMTTPNVQNRLKSNRPKIKKNGHFSKKLIFCKTFIIFAKKWKKFKKITKNVKNGQNSRFTEKPHSNAFLARNLAKPV